MASLRAVDLRAFGLAVTYVAASTALAYAVEPYARHSDLAMIHLLGVVFVAIRFSLRTTMFACALSILAFDYLFIPPRFAFAWTDARSAVTFVAMLVVGGIISGLNERLRHEEHVARTAAFRSQALYELNVHLSTAADARQLAALTVRHLERLFSGKVTILLGAPENWSEGIMPETIRHFAEECWLRRELIHQEAHDAAWLWAPVIGVHAPLGVIGVALRQRIREDAADDFLLSAAAHQLAAAIDRTQLANVVHRTELETQAERLRSSLLSAVSHDLKTPLSSMIAAATTLLGREQNVATLASRELLSTIIAEGERLSRLIRNLLSITRLESEGLALRKTSEAVEEIISSAVERFRTPQGTPGISVRVEPDLPLVQGEPLLLEQVLVNLLDNARRYAGADANIVVQARAVNDNVVVGVADDGPGIAEEEREKVFEKFYRGKSAGKSDGGVGLGLTICRAIVRAHGGRITIRERSGGGTMIEFALPAVSSVPSESPLAAELSGS